MWRLIVSLIMVCHSELEQYHCLSLRRNGGAGLPWTSGARDIFAREGRECFGVHGTQMVDLSNRKIPEYIRPDSEVSDEDKSASDAEKHMAKTHTTKMPEGTVSNAAFANVLVIQLKPVLEPLLTSRGLLWEPCLPYIKKVCQLSISHRVVLPALCLYICLWCRKLNPRV